MLSPTVYLSGPLAYCTEREATGWRLEARQLLPQFDFADPSRRWAGGNYQSLSAEEKRKLVERDLDDIANSDAVLANVWKNSVGTLQEIVYAHQWRVPLVIICPSLDPSPWLLYHGEVVTSVTEAAEWLRKKFGVLK